MGEALEAAFASVARVALSFERLTTIKDPFALGRRDGEAAAARFTLGMNGGVCEGLLLLPQAFLLPFRAELANDPETEALPADRRWSRLMEAGVQQTRLPVTAILEEVPMSLGDVANFQIGGLLPLQCNDFTAIRLECSGRGMFTCKLGQADGRYRLEVESPIAQDTKQPSRKAQTTPRIADDSDTLEQDISWTQPPSPLSRPSPSTRPKSEPIAGAPNLDAILSIPVTVQVVLGSTSLPVSGLMKLARGAIVSLDQRVGDPVDVVVNGTVIARGEIVVVDDASQRFGVSLLEVVAGGGLKQPTKAPQETGHA